MFFKLTLRDSSHSQSNSDLKVVDSSTDPGSTMNRVIKVTNVDHPDSNTDERDNLGELLTKLIQFLLQRGLLLLCCSHLVTDLTDLSGHTSSDSNSNSLASSNICALWVEVETNYLLVAILPFCTRNSIAFTQ